MIEERESVAREILMLLRLEIIGAVLSRLHNAIYGEKADYKGCRNECAFRESTRVRKGNLIIKTHYQLKVIAICELLT
jgi:hypothetical protein